MIHIGLDRQERARLVAEKFASCGAEKIVVLGDPLSEVPDGVEADNVSFQQAIEYVHYYRLLQKIDAKTLVVWNGFFRTTNRYALNYNCARRYFQQTPNRLIFEPFPLRERKEDFMVLWDMAQPNPFQKEPFEAVKKFDGVHFYADAFPQVETVEVKLTPQSLVKYARLKEAAILAVRKDPDIIPRRLLKFSEAENARQTGQTFDAKNTLKPRMRIAVNQTGVDKYFAEKLMQKISDIKEIYDKR